MWPNEKNQEREPIYPPTPALSTPPKKREREETLVLGHVAIKPGELAFPVLRRERGNDSNKLSRVVSFKGIRFTSGVGPFPTERQQDMFAVFGAKVHKHPHVQQT